ncbi:MAG: RluA family pseudouridine synthase [Kiritimatiellae bacterium]|nr:RluA family pseudouridine synthase [Kiritimatiellia bacterium]
MIENVTFQVSEGGIRLDAALLMRFPTIPRAFAREACEAGMVKINGRVAQKGCKLRGGESIEVLHLDEADDNRPLADSSIHPKCVFEDEYLLAFDKPAGISVQPLTRKETGTLMNGVVHRWPQCIGVGDSSLMAGALHRIDSGTSGLVLVAKTAEAFDRLRAQFAAQTVRKTYLALVEGAVAFGGTLENDLVHMPGLGYCKMVDIHKGRLSESERRSLQPKALHAVTSYAPLGLTREGNEERTLLEVNIHTGVTHQIRVQLAIAGMHIVNDRLYGAFAVENMVGHCLHALSACFVHPISGESCEIRTNYPDWYFE